MTELFPVTIKLTERELDVLRALCGMKDLTEEQVLLQALRLYQRISVADADKQAQIEKILDPSPPVGCPSPE